MASKKKRKRAGQARKSNPSKPTAADLADKFVCYQQSVQSPDHEVEFFEQAFREAYGRRPFTLREDFCGTFSVCCEWVRSRKRRIAIGVDLCADTLNWGREHNLAELSTAQQKRITLIQDDVRSQHGGGVDVLAAQNFSFWVFKTRDEVVRYFKTARANLKAEGIMVIDMMGGGDCYLEGNVDRRKIGKGKKAFHYEWDQAEFDPITRDATTRIHFSFPDGSRLDTAFEYQWRFWTLPEIRELLEEAGFSESHVYWEIEDADGEDTGEFERAEHAENCEAWICYVVAIK